MTSRATAEDQEAMQEPPLRGSLRLKSRMEMLQDSYLRAVAAAAGCQLAKPDPDDGIDWILTHSSTRHTADCQVDLKVQLKSTSQIDPNPKNGHVAVRVERRRFEMLALSPVINPRILVAMIVPRSVEFWIKSSHDYLSLRHCAYWINLEGYEAGGAEEVTVSVPTSNIFDDVSLCLMMKHLGVGGKL